MTTTNNSEAIRHHCGTCGCCGGMIHVAIRMCAAGGSLASVPETSTQTALAERSCTAIDANMTVSGDARLTIDPRHAGITESHRRSVAYEPVQTGFFYAPTRFWAKPLTAGAKSVLVLAGVSSHTTDGCWL